MLRAQLRIKVAGTDKDKAAAWALVHACWKGERVCTGLSDREGRVALVFAYPEPRPKHLHRSSPPQSFSEKTWMIALEARYTPRAGDDPVPEMESLEKILAQEARPLLKAVSPAVVLPEQTLQLGSELVVHSDGSSYLFVQTT